MGQLNLIGKTVFELLKKQKDLFGKLKNRNFPF